MQQACRQLKFMALFCLPFLIIGSALTIHEVSFQVTGAHTKGTIVRWETDDTSFAVFEFTDVRTGQKITATNPLSGGSYRVGDSARANRFGIQNTKRIRIYL